jgi:GLPGLI family protein
MIPVSTGPDDFFGLPGLILHVDINEGERLITAQGIDLKTLDENEIVRPTEGKKISSDDFAELRDKKMEEMKQERGGKGMGSGRRFGRGR